jgi:hypothetical protein
VELSKIERKNIARFSAKESIYVAIIPVLWGTIMQQFLLYREVSATLVGIYTTLVSAVQMVAMMLFSGVSERTETPLKYCSRILLGVAGITLAYLPIVFFDLGSHLTVFLVCLFSIVQISLHSCKYIYDYRVNYQIVSSEKYGTMLFLGNAFTGVAGVAFSWLFAWMIDTNSGGNPYFVCMALTLALMLITVFFNSPLKTIYPLPTHKKEQLGLKQQFQIVMADESFRKLMVPNFMRGITLSVTGCVVLFALVMGIDESGRAKIPLVCAAATVLSSVVYLLLSKKLSTATINIIGGVLTCAMIFMPYGNTVGFLALFFISYLGRIIVDNAVPTMLFPLIDPKIAGSYNAWRCVLYNLCSIIVTPIISVLVEKVDPLWLLIPGTVTYVIVTVWYYIVCKKLTKA